MEITKENKANGILLLRTTYNREWRIEEIIPDRNIQMPKRECIREHMH